ncbi:MMPL family transporter, partial [Paraconexibacter sp.]|uniref:MMPL family transporter n=1 Tax=Paraconexibacter sp. TaxID=2949640 RepID=UPI0035666266
MLARLAHLTARHRKAIIVAWIASAVFGGFAAGQVSERWLQSFANPGHSAYEASQRTFERFGTGERPPSVVVFHTEGDATKSKAIPVAMERARQASPGARTSSYFSTGSDAYVSEDRHTTFMEVYPTGTPQLATKSGADAMRTAAAAGLPAGTTVHVTGLESIMEANERGETSGPSVLVEALIGGLGALIVLFFVFGTLPAVLLPLAIAVASILNTFTLVWLLTYVTDVSIVVQFLI